MHTGRSSTTGPDDVEAIVSVEEVERMLEDLRREKPR